MSDVRNRTEGEQRKGAESSVAMETLCAAAYEGLMGVSPVMLGVLGTAALKAGVKVGEAIREMGEDALIMGALFSPAGAIAAKAAEIGMLEGKKFMDAQAKKK